jgi:hypothetical protein
MANYAHLRGPVRISWHDEAPGKPASITVDEGGERLALGLHAVIVEVIGPAGQRVSVVEFRQFAPSVTPHEV